MSDQSDWFTKWLEAWQEDFLALKGEREDDWESFSPIDLDDLNRVLELSDEYTQFLKGIHTTADHHPIIMTDGHGNDYLPFFTFWGIGKQYQDLYPGIPVPDRAVKDQHGNTLFIIKGETLRFLRHYVYGWPQPLPRQLTDPKTPTSFDGKRRSQNHSSTS